jgi:hypothetical protein
VTNQVFTADPSAERLNMAVRDGVVVLVVGSGLSAGIYPSWHSLVEELRSHCGVETTVALSADTPVQLLLEIADEAYAKDKSAFDRILRRHFSTPKTRTHPGYEVLLSTREFRSYVTINFDPLLVNVAQRLDGVPGCSGMKLVKYPEIMSRLLENRNIFYLHGCVEQGTTPASDRLILTKSGFDEAYSPQKSLLPQFWDVLLSQYVALFVGCGLREPAIQVAMRNCRTRKDILKSRDRMSMPPAYILRPAQYVLGQSERDLEKERREQAEFDNFGVTIVRYDPKDDDHSGLLEVLEAWNPAKTMSVYHTHTEAWAPHA